jgi:NAD(P)-dependent dehydrogenase (short-subunit alcohol dehydrogenase family)
MKAVVLGASRANIGAAVRDHLIGDGWDVDATDCLDPDGVYRIPNLDFKTFDAMVVTLGHTRMVEFDQATEDDINEVIRGSLVLPLMAAKAYVQERNSRGGAVVLVGSYAHDHALTNGAAYCASKAGLAAAVRELAWELTPLFFFHIVHPYHVPDTPMGARVVQALMEAKGMTREEAEAYQRKDLRMPHHLEPVEIAEVIGWLLSEPAAKWTAGSGINLYGGSR